MTSEEQRLQRHNKALSSLYEITLEILSHRSMNTLLQSIVKNATQLFDAPYGEIMLLEGDELVVHAFTENQAFLAADRLRYNEASISWKAFTTQKPVILEDYSNWSARRDIYSSINLFATADFPILSEERCLGVLAVGRDQPGYIFDEEQIQIGSLFAQLAALVIDNARLYLAAQSELEERRRLESALRKANKQLLDQISEINELQASLLEQAIRDPLTGLHNRRYLLESLQQEFARASRGNYPISVAIIDIDHFKAINDMYGHEAGDKVLRQFGAQIRSLVRSGDIACRYGGEEFVLVMHNALSHIAAERAEQCRKSAQNTPIIYDSQPIHITISVGIASFPANGTTIDDVIRAADKALYRAKAAGRNCVVIA